MSKQVRKKSYNGKTGYALHVDRLSYTGKDGMRSFKFPLGGNDEARDTFWNTIREDYIGQVGGVNFSDWYVAHTAGETLYSLADFWVDSLRAGIIFAHKEADVHDIIRHLNEEESFFETFVSVLKEKKADLASLADARVLYEFFISSQRPSGKTQEDFFASWRKRMFPALKDMAHATPHL